MKTKKILILGAGKSGLAAAELLNSKKFSVFVSDQKDKGAIKKDPAFKKSFFLLSEEEAQKKAKEKTFLFAVKSPGIDNSAPLIKKLKELKIPIKSELECALLFAKTKNIIAITGTNGKTTTTHLCAEIMGETLKKKNAKAYACGNIGFPVSLAVKKAKKDDCLIIEASSYQLEDSIFFKPKVSAILNITLDHLEHHKTMDNYIKAKSKIFLNQDKKDFCIFNLEDKIVSGISKNCLSNVLFFSLKKTASSDAFYLKNKVCFRLAKKTVCLCPPKLPGKHNIQNSLAAALCAIYAGAGIKDIRSVFKRFKAIAHRIELVRTFNGITYYNDSKATNVDSTLIALKSFAKKKNIWLILGGKDKKAPYAPLKKQISQKVKTIIAIGEARPIIKKQLSGISPLIEKETIFEALDLIKEKAKTKDIALLSPACASYDQFSNFEERGEKFKKYVLSW